MQKQKWYYDVKFAPHVIQTAYEMYLSCLGEHNSTAQSLEVTIGPELLDFDTIQECLAEYPKATMYKIMHFWKSCRFSIHSPQPRRLLVSIKLDNRSDIEKIFQIFEQNLDTSKLVIAQTPITIFIGHGHDSQWRDLKDHLHDQHGFQVSAYEIGPRAGLSVKEILETMLGKSSFALLVLTGEDIHSDGEPHARENVIHELGLFQARLGFTRAIVLLEDNVKEFSNILGINQIRFGRGRIRETFGDVIATIRREFQEKR
jgi:predicted nucleotide-binding protein